MRATPEMSRLPHRPHLFNQMRQQKETQHNWKQLRQQPPVDNDRRRTLCICKSALRKKRLFWLASAVRVTPVVSRPCLSHFQRHSNAAERDQQSRCVPRMEGGPPNKDCNRNKEVQRATACKSEQHWASGASVLGLAAS